MTDVERDAIKYEDFYHILATMTLDSPTMKLAKLALAMQVELQKVRKNPKLAEELITIFKNDSLL